MIPTLPDTNSSATSNGATTTAPNGNPAAVTASSFSLSPAFIWGALQQNRGLFLTASSIMMGWVAAYALFMYQPSFSAHSMVIIKESALTKRFVESDQYYAPQNTSSSSTNPVLNTLELLHSKTVVEGLYDYFVANHPEELRKMRIKNLQEWQEFFGTGASLIKAKNKVGTDYISIDFAWKKPEIAQQGLEAILASFKQASLVLNKAEQQERAAYLTAQAEEMEKRLTTLREQKSKLRSSAMTLNVEQENINLDTTRMQLEQELNSLKAKMQGDLAEKSRYQALLGTNSQDALRAASIGNNSQLEKLYTELYSLNKQYAEQSKNYTDASPNIIQLKAQIEQAQNNIDKELKRTLGKQYTPSAKSQLSFSDTNRSTLVNNMVATEARALNTRHQINTLQSRLAQINQRIHNAPDYENKIVDIDEQDLSLSKALQNLRERILETKLKEAQTLSNVFVIDPPALPSKAEFPQRSHILILGLLAAIATGISSVLLKVKLAPAKIASGEKYPFLYANPKHPSHKTHPSAK